jgi:hypothetical protein
MKRLRKFSSVAFIASFMLFYASCKKEQKGADGITITKVTSEELLSKVKAFQDEEIKNGQLIFKRKYEEGELVFRAGDHTNGNTQTVEAFCFDNVTFQIKTIGAEYRNFSCFSTGSYYIYLEFFIGHQGMILNNANNLPLTLSYFANGTTNTINLIPQLVSVTSKGSNFKCAPFVFPNYCVTMSDLTLQVAPNVTCSGGQNETGNITAIATNIFTDQCKSIAPAFVQANLGGAGTVGLNGFFPCSSNQYNPCFVFPNQIEFQYKLQSATQWSSFILTPYLYNASIVNGLQAGIYEFKWRNTKITSPKCNGPFSEIITRTIN